MAEGLVQLWQGRIAALEGRQVRAKDNSPNRYVGAPRMTAISRHLAEDLPIAFKTRIIEVSRNGLGWQLTAEAGVASACYDAVILAIPPAQAVPLLAEAPRLADQAASVQCQPCWSLMTAFDQGLPLAFDGVFLNSPVLAWAARNSSKPGRKLNENWVIHASPDWSRRHLEDDASAVVAPLLEAFFGLVGAQPCQPVFSQAHRWRYAKADAPLTVGCLWDSNLCLGACGDWCAGSRVEGAALSGMAIAGRVMGLTERTAGISS
jgi:predicted NAD/FAD-dependent oxidoreductase